MGIPELSLAGKKALVTGARRGIGRTLALALAEAGADVAVADMVIDDGELEKTIKEIQERGRKAFSVQVNISIKAQVEEMVEKVAACFGSIDVLINNAGVASFGPMLELSEAEWDRVISTNLKGSFLCAQAVGKKMVEQKKGTIISLASQFAFKAIPNFGVYSIAKAGIAMLTRILARELGGQGIRVNAIAPGLVRTELTRVEWEDPVLMKNRVAGIPLGRIAEPSDLAGLVLFLASDASRYISGQTIIIDGGEIT